MRIVAKVSLLKRFKTLVIHRLTIKGSNCYIRDGVFNINLQDEFFF